MSCPYHTNDDLIRGLVPVTYMLDRPLPTRWASPLVTGQHDDYVWLEYRRGAGLAPAAVQQAVADTLTSVLQDVHNLEVPQEMALKGLGFRVVLRRDALEAPSEVDLSYFAAATPPLAGTDALPRHCEHQQSHNARLGAWVHWGILQQDRHKFRFVVYPVTTT
ncbi:uncharacterized protein PG998_008998 [Apiospora kogelbergensis]|uniref:Aminoglycoside phosphotransferase domain-containing protein n=1 Tax=Apiospora kogelbergensis TaxID=1337665 RepID=A0AAW0R6H0_9PEZI